MLTLHDPRTFAAALAIFTVDGDVLIGLWQDGDDDVSFLEVVDDGEGEDATPVSLYWCGDLIGYWRDFGDAWEAAIDVVSNLRVSMVQ